MTHDEHREHHRRLHRYLDELFADFITHNPLLFNYTEQPILALMKWSYEQTIAPTEIKTGPQHSPSSK